MTQAIDTLLTLFLTFNHATVNAAITAGGGTEQLTADPTIVIRNTYMEAPPAYNADGYIILTGETRGVAIEMGEFRHIPYFIEGHVYYESKTDKDSLVIQSIIDQLESLMNVNNNSNSRGWRYLFKTPHDYSNIPQIGRVDFTVHAIKTDVSAIT